MQYTRRIAAALRGEYLEPLAPEEDEDDAAVGIGGWKLAGHESGAEEGGDDWQDLAAYQAEQTVEIGEIAPRTNAVQEGGKEPEIQATAGPDGRKRKKDRADGQTDTGLDKEARKKAKKERALQQRRENAKKAE
jgi:hypothetical protein